MELREKSLDKIHIIEDSPLYSQYVFRALLHIVNGMQHTGSIQVQGFYRILGLIPADIRTPEGI